ncbi:MAG: GxxExxY protein [Candidatus Berkelbacteria bacterium]|nr:GxxExxY protein [Candidatus Berkelbacteria bacterium]
MPQIDTDNTLNELSKKLIGLAFETYNFLGAGYSERIYQNMFAELLKESEVGYIREKYSQLIIHGKRIGGHKVDFLVDDKIVVEMKCRSEIYPKDIAQVINYLKVNAVKLGLIFCFTTKGVKIKRFVY